MSITEYINKLEIEQVKFAKSVIDKRLRYFNEGKNVVLYIVSDTCLNVGCYKEGDFSSAKQHLAKLILSERFDESELRDVPTVRKILVKEEEVEGWMEINESH